ncbi:MAG TPA: RNase adapter RapZ [Bacillota bacterium]|nr:RNase adapter RapZ [Bacillota bacterium]HPE38163.1 RNase adapter RapZ [Bacillota bacterium]
MDVIILTGMSGAGKSQAANFLEDQGYFCIDNLPPMVLPELVRTFLKGQGGEGYAINKLAFVVDIRSNELLKGFGKAITEIQSLECPYRIIFLEANDQVLVNRYRQTRRKHPLSQGLSLSEAISKERELLRGIRARATHTIDTSMMAMSGLREELQSIIDIQEVGMMDIHVESFGFKYGIPVDCDNIYDVRFLPNPFYEPTLKMMSGKDAPIEEYLLSFDETKEYLQKQIDLLTYSIPFYIREGKARLMIGVGCTGGRHRSVYVAICIHKALSDLGYRVSIHHRDIDKDPRYVQPKNTEEA